MKDDKRREDKEGKNRMKSKVERKCFRCGSYGHIQRECMSQYQWASAEEEE